MTTIVMDAKKEEALNAMRTHFASVYTKGNSVSHYYSPPSFLLYDRLFLSISQVEGGVHRLGAFPVNDACFLRYLQARNFDVTKAKAMVPVNRMICCLLNIDLTIYSDYL